MNLFSKRIFPASVALAAATIAVSAQTAMNLGNLPLWFEANHSENGTAAQFVAHGRDSEFSVSPSGAEIVLRQSDGKTSAVQMKFASANHLAAISGDAELSGKINYFIGSDPARWQSGVPTFGKVRLNNIYPGVNVIYYGSQQQLEYDFDLAAGVNPDTIAIRFDGAEKISVNPQGELVVKLNGGKVTQHQPVAYQTIAGARHEIKAGYKTLDAHTAAFAIGNYDHSLPLVIDPILSFSTFFGGNHGETGWAIALDGSTNIYVAGQTLSTQVSNNIPLTTINAAYPNFGGGSIVGDAFVAKFDNLGTNLLYCTYLGGSLDDVAYALAVDAAGHAYVAGYTDSTNFPVKNPVTYGTFSGAAINGVVDHNVGHYPVDAFVSELETNGSSLIYSTYLGGEGADAAYGIALDATGDAFVTGFTYSTNFPATAKALYQHLRCTNNFYINANTFVAEIAGGGKYLNYSTFLGGSNYDVGTAVAFNNGNVLVAGYTLSTNFPWTNGLTACKYLNGSNYLNSGAADAFVTGFAAVGTNLALLYSTYLGSSNTDQATGIAADAAGNAYVVGWTASTNFPSTTNGVNLTSFVRTNTLGFVVATNAFLTQVKWDGTNASLGYSRMFGGYGVDVANGVALDPTGNVFVIGSASSVSNFPTTGSNLIGSLRTTNSGASDVFVTVFKSDFSALLYSAYLGGAANDFGHGIAVDAAGSAYLTGQTIKTTSSNQTNFPNFNARQTILDGTNDIFLAKIIMASTPPLAAHSSGGKVLVTWPPVGQAIPPFIGLETSTNLINTNWTVITNQAPVLTNGNYTFTFNPTNQARFFRFHKF